MGLDKQIIMIKKKKSFNDFLNELATLKFASLLNLSSVKASTHKGSVQQVDKYIKRGIAFGYIKEVPVNWPNFYSKNEQREYKRWNALYCLTKDGYIFIDRESEYHQEQIKAFKKLEHESMKIFFCKSLLDNFPDFDFHFTHEPNLNGIKPDVLVRAKNYFTGKEYTYLVEIERKREANRTHRDKVLKYAEKFKNGWTFSKNRLSPNSKIIFVFSNLLFSGFRTPLKYNQKDYKEIKDSLYKSFDEYINSQKYYSNTMLFLPYPEHPDISGPVFRMLNKNKVSIFQ